MRSSCRISRSMNRPRPSNCEVLENPNAVSSSTNTATSSILPPIHFKAKVEVILTPATSMTAIFRLSGIITFLECANKCLDHYTYEPTLSNLKLMCKDRASFEVEGKKVDYIKAVRNYLSIPDDI